MEMFPFKKTEVLLPFLLIVGQIHAFDSSAIASVLFYTEPGLCGAGLAQATQRPNGGCQDFWSMHDESSWTSVRWSVDSNFANVTIFEGRECTSGNPISQESHCISQWECCDDTDLTYPTLIADGFGSGSLVKKQIYRDSECENLSSEDYLQVGIPVITEVCVEYYLDTFTQKLIKRTKTDNTPYICGWPVQNEYFPLNTCLNGTIWLDQI